MRAFAWSVIALLVVVALAIVSCSVDECGDIDTLDISTTEVCFSVTYTCSSPAAQVVSSTACGTMLSDWAIHSSSSQSASCTINVTCADGRQQSLQAEWVPNGTCAPITVIGGFSGTVCDVDGGLPPPVPEASTDSSDASDDNE